MSENFGRRMRAYRKLKHWTQNELADHIGVSVAIIGSLERGTRLPTSDQLLQITRVLNVTETELFLEQPRTVSDGGLRLM